MQTFMKKTKCWNKRACTNLEEGYFTIDSDQSDMITTVYKDKTSKQTKKKCVEDSYMSSKPFDCSIRSTFLREYLIDIRLDCRIRFHHSSFNLTLNRTFQYILSHNKIRPKSNYFKKSIILYLLSPYTILFNKLL